MTGLTTLPIGALYCAYEAQGCGFTSRPTGSNRWRIELDDAISAAGAFARGRLPAEPSWIRKVHFNSALMRIDVGFERLIRFMTGSHSCAIAALLPLARGRPVPESALAIWRKVRSQEVNALKHRNPEALTMERMTYQDLVKAMDTLVTLLERTLERGGR